ncbi:MAG TPA: hypothetical protein VGI40_24620 [Pirellulaceae bacterium]
MSVTDGLVIVAGIVGAVGLWFTAWWLGFTVAFVVGHFFVFCNVFRVARPLELAWSGVFVVLTYGTVMFDRPNWVVTIGCSLLATVVIIGLEMRKPSYHGVLWRRINPGLRQWWEADRGILG